MEYDQFKNNLGRIARKSFTVKKQRNDKGISYPYIYFDKPVTHPKKK